jgi:hypothetical protein
VAAAANCEAGALGVVVTNAAGPGGGDNASLAGTWRNLSQTATPAGDLAVIDTRWTFALGGACVRMVVTTLVKAGTADTVATSCTYAFNGSIVSIRYAGSSVVVSFRVILSAETLIMGGVRFSRLG